MLSNPKWWFVEIQNDDRWDKSPLITASILYDIFILRPYFQYMKRKFSNQHWGFFNKIYQLHAIINDTNNALCRDQKHWKTLTGDWLKAGELKRRWNINKWTEKAVYIKTVERAENIPELAGRRFCITKLTSNI